MTIEAIAEEIRSLPVEERKQLVMLILDSLTDEQPEKTHSTKAELIADLRQSLQEAVSGQTIPASDFLAALDSDD